MSYFVTKEAVLRIVNGGWLTETPIQFHSEKLNMTFTVPIGFFTDLASVPRAMRWLVPVANAKNRQAAIVHDYLCFKEVQEKYGITQRQADMVFREALAVCNVNPIGQWFMWTPVRIYQWWKNK